MTKIKICGLTRPQDIISVNAALPDFAGFVFAESRRMIDERTARTLKDCLQPAIKSVGVFVDEDPNRIIRLCEDKVIDLVQLHGGENDTYIVELKKRIPNTIIKAVRVKYPAQISAAQELSSDYLLLDTWHPRQYGGTGMTFDWDIIPELHKPYFLAGGLNIGNILEAVKSCRPFCVDVSGGVETGFCKDPNKIMEIVYKIRSVK